MSGDSADGLASDSVGERQVPFYCPYCGDEALRPAGAQGGGWDCTACSRSFQLRFVGVLPSATR